MSVQIHAPSIRPRRRQRGIALILVTVGALALIGMAGLALDLGVTYIAKSRLQNALDAAALRGAKVLNKTRSASLATTAAQADFAANMGGISVTATVEMSPTLQPFVNGGVNLRFVRVSVAALPITLRLAQALPQDDGSDGPPPALPDDVRQGRGLFDPNGAAPFSRAGHKELTFFYTVYPGAATGPLLAGFSVFLSRLSRQVDVLVGTPIANRNRLEVEDLIGTFVNTLVLRTDVTSELTFRELPTGHQLTSTDVDGAHDWFNSSL